MSHRRRLVDPPTSPAPAPCVTVDGQAARLALRLAHGDRRRLTVLPDGAVLVRNQPQQPPGVIPGR